MILLNLSKGQWPSNLHLQRYQCIHCNRDKYIDCSPDLQPLCHHKGCSVLLHLWRMRKSSHLRKLNMLLTLLYRNRPGVILNRCQHQQPTYIDEGTPQPYVRQHEAKYIEQGIQQQHLMATEQPSQPYVPHPESTYNQQNIPAQQQRGYVPPLKVQKVHHAPVATAGSLAQLQDPEQGTDDVYITPPKKSAIKKQPEANKSYEIILKPNIQ